MALLVTPGWRSIAFAFVATAFVAARASVNGIAPTASMRDVNGLATQRALEGAAVSTAAWPKTNWWKAFNDPQLEALINEALAGAPTLNIAAARTRKALAAADTTKAALYPQVDGSFSSTRERFSGQGLVPPPMAGTWNTVNQLQVTLGWELDFWGKNRSAYESAVGEAKAAEVDEHAARLALSADIAQAYVRLQRAYLELDVAQITLREREQI